ncbi:helix-turn-helix domain-containing protein [Nocardia cyriacigeorgica]|uniref:helix-turn-helix domain-containing protein n=1 Tax=Nocardia cyriacigeorgica TaxID=135487 RepID=UPI0009DA30FC|nr:hypothetical protein FMUAM8_31750 [Nocardia cyriacigeorgica]
MDHSPSITKSRSDSHESPSEPVVAEVARRTGFTNVSHFNRRFRAEYGMAPLQWRSLQRAGR